MCLVVFQHEGGIPPDHVIGVKRGQLTFNAHIVVSQDQRGQQVIDGSKSFEHGDGSEIAFLHIGRHRDHEGFSGQLPPFAVYIGNAVSLIVYQKFIKVFFQQVRQAKPPMGKW